VSRAGATSAGTGCGLAAPLCDGEALSGLLGGCRHPGGLELTDRAVRLAGLAPGSAVLDVGCGDGVTAEHLERRHGLRVVGVDVAAALLTQGRERRPGLDLREGSAARLPLPDASVDAVLAECVLSILDEPGAALDEWARVLRPGGGLLMNDLFRRADPDAARRLLDGAGFVVEVWEDHSSALARLVWDLAAAGVLGAEGPAADGAASCRRAATPAAPGRNAIVPAAPGRNATTPAAPGRSAAVPAALRGGGGLGYYLCVARSDGPVVRTGEDAT
jgi:SAM-dependent methyltransferase